MGWSGVWGDVMWGEMRWDNLGEGMGYDGVGFCMVCWGCISRYIIHVIVQILRLFSKCCIAPYLAFYGK